MKFRIEIDVLWDKANKTTEVQQEQRTWYGEGDEHTEDALERAMTDITEEICERCRRTMERLGR